MMMMALRRVSLRRWMMLQLLKLFLFVVGAVEQRLFVLELLDESANISGVENGRREIAIVLEISRMLPRSTRLMLMIMMVMLILAMAMRLMLRQR